MHSTSASLYSVGHRRAAVAMAASRRQITLRSHGLRHTPASHHFSTTGSRLSLSPNPPARNISSTRVRPAQEFAMPALNYGQPFMPFVGHVGNDEFWRQIPYWEHVSQADFLSWKWSTKNVLEFHKKSDQDKFRRTLAVLTPHQVPLNKTTGEMQSREDFIDDIFAGLERSTMSVRIMPHTVSRINWKDPRHDPIFRQFLPLNSVLLPNHPKCKHDSLDEKNDSKIEGLVHRYHDKALFLATPVCPTYCAYCTRAYAIGADTLYFSKKGEFKPSKSRWDECLEYIANTPRLQDIVISGGDAYYLHPENIRDIGKALLEMPNIKKIRFATKGLAVSPTRILDPEDDWTSAIIEVSQMAERMGKRMALHTHFNHPNEISWVTEMASRRLRDAGVTVRNQSVLLRGVNDDVETMSTLIRKLADTLRIQPYYVYQCDMVKNAEHFRTPLQTILDMEDQILGSIAGFDIPKFIVDLPGGGGKRSAFSYRSYDRTTGVSTFIAPAVKGETKNNRVYEYYDPLDTLPKKDDPGANAARGSVQHA